MSKVTFEQLLDAGVHFGHLKRKWNPAMAPYIFMEKNGIHIIDLQKTAIKLEEACSALKQIAKSGRKILFVATKKQAKDIVADKVKRVNMPFVTERWPGGMLTNFPTIRKAVKKMASIDKMSTDGTFDNLSKREKLQVNRQRAKLEKNLGSIADLTRLPAALFVVDVTKEHIAVKEARRLSIPVFAMVDTNSNPNIIDFPIPANDDASKSISLIIEMIAASIEEGLQERKFEKDSEPARDKKSRKGDAEDLDEEEIEEGEESEEEASVDVPDEIEGAILDGDIEPVVDAAKKVKLAKKAAPAKKIAIKKVKKDDEA
jgi:small subunit ribosomal protein S2